MIDFDVLSVTLPDLDFSRVKKWLDEIASAHGKYIGRINYLFCDDAEILRVNREFLKHDYFTDIITFDYSRGERVGGDIVISLDTVKDNAKSFGFPYETELLRVIAHGLLHLCGIDDKGPGEREIMELHENRALELYGTL